MPELFLMIARQLKAGAQWCRQYWDLALLSLCITLMGMLLIDTLLPEPRLEISLHQINAEALSKNSDYADNKTSIKLPQDVISRESININTANTKELQRLPGIGPAMASRIISYRQQRGAFTRVEDLDNVRGIGAKTLEKLRPQVRLQD